MGVGTFSLLWTALADEELATVQRYVRGRGGIVTSCKPPMLGSLVGQLLGEGAVIAVVPTDVDASLALLWGADEVLRTGEVNEATLARAVERALARAAGRLGRELARTEPLEEWTTFSLLSAALSNELAGPLALARSRCQTLAANLDELVGLNREFVRWASDDVGPPESLRHLVARSLANSGTDQLCAAVHDVREAVERATSMLGILQDVSLRGEAPAISLATLVSDLTSVLGGHVRASAEFRAKAAGPCMVTIPRPTATTIVVSLLAAAIDGVRSVPNSRILLNLTEQEDCVLLELWYSADRGRLQVSPSERDQNSPAYGDVASVRDQARAVGGDLLLDADATGTTFRLFLPLATGEEAFELPDEEIWQVSKTVAS